MGEQSGRPPVAVGHMFLETAEPKATIKLLLGLGCRSIVTRDDFAVLELRGGTHVVVRDVEKDQQPEVVGWDIMVDDIDRAHADYSEKGLKVSNIRRGRIHDNFDLTLPDGRIIEINNNHAGDRAV